VTIAALTVVAAVSATWGALALARSSDATNPGSVASDGPSKAPAQVQVMSSQYGDVLSDGKGYALYLFTRDKPDKSRCYGSCARVWPPFKTKGKPTAGVGIDASLLGTAKRKNGSKQVTYAGHPLYYYEHDDEAGEILCHDVNEFGGRWLVVQPDGNPAP
jgi:predicted lipoprotein with Yx(FWY)xxD motif